MATVNINESCIRSLVREAIASNLRRRRRPLVEEMIAYHGSKANFDQFSIAYIGTGTGAQEFGYGIYLTFDPETAYGYGGVIYKVMIPDENQDTYLYYDRPVPKEIIEQIYAELLEVNRLEFPDEFKDEQACQDFIGELREVMPPTEGRYVMYNIGKYVFEKTQVPMIMRRCGVCGFIYNNGKVDNAVMFDSRKIKIIDKEFKDY